MLFVLKLKLYGDKVMIKAELRKAIKKLQEPHKNKASMGRSAGISHAKLYKLIRDNGENCTMKIAIKLWTLFGMDKGLLAWEDVQRRLREPALNYSYIARKTGVTTTTVINARNGNPVNVDTAQALWDFFHLPQK